LTQNCKTVFDVFLTLRTAKIIFDITYFNFNERFETDFGGLFLKFKNRFKTAR